MTGCAAGDEPGGKGKKQSPSGHPEPTDTAGLEDAPPAADTASAASPDNAWRYTHLAPEQDGSYRAMAVASRDDVWLLGTRGQSAPVPFLEHWDGTRWSEPGLSDELKVGGRYFSWALAAGGPGELWLGRRTSQGGRGPVVLHRRDGTWRRLPDAPAVLGDALAVVGIPEATWCVASEGGLWINHYGRVLQALGR